MLQTPMCIELKPSTVLRGLSLAFILCCAYAVWYAAAPRVGLPYALSAVLVVALALSYLTYRAHAEQPAQLEISAQSITLWSRTAPPIDYLHISNIAYWSGLMLSITLRANDGRRRKLLILADALPAHRLRELVVRCRQLARNCNRQL
ncbi:protein YgfX [Mycoavidus sp. B2-EB]|uniref:protein YgfX n=1 Tax=Mycoavidus sp. B2-EB TaxID=2651972 RepID=UPI001626732E|nr:protein YgfX [Mycoavidus sp. B2-EB]BBO59387.1 hypothetical protein MPB2EB_0503 [Mycoavidus sp. B2-EB]